MMGEAVAHSESKSGAHSRDPSQTRQLSPPAASRARRQQSPAPLPSLEIIQREVAAGTAPAVPRETTPVVESHRKLNALEQLMSASVQETEAANKDKDRNHEPVQLRVDMAPEVTGFDRDAEAKRAAAGMAAQFLANAATFQAKHKTIMAKDDSINVALRAAPKEDYDDVDVLSFMNKKPATLAATKSGFDPPAPKAYPPLVTTSKPPEETAEENPELAYVEGQPFSGPDPGLEDQWEAVGMTTKKMAAEAMANRGVVAQVDDEAVKPITFNEVRSWIGTIQIDESMMSEFREDDDTGGVSCGCYGNRSRKRGDVPKLQTRLNKEKDVILFLTKTEFNFNIIPHHRMLRTIFTKVTRNKACPTVGKHWEVIGFQGGDPRTDLNRFGGVFNIICLFYFMAHHDRMLKDIWLLSTSDEQHFPMACISVNLTRMVMEAFLEGRLSSLCNNGRLGHSLLETLCEIHAGALFVFYSRWRHEKRKIQDTDRTLKEIRALLTRKPAKMMDEFSAGVQGDRARDDPNKLEFTSMEFGSAGGNVEQAAPKAKPKNLASMPKRYKGGEEAE
jgi:hypothetical protein